MTRRAGLIVTGLAGITSAVLLVSSIPLKLDIVGGVPARVGAAVTPLSFMLFSIVGWVVVARRGNHPVGWLFSAAGIGWALMWFSGVVVERAHFLDESAPDPIVWLASWTEIIGIVASLLALFVFPTGTLLSRRWQPWIVVAVGGGLIAMIGEAFATGPLEDYPYVESPYPLGGVANVLRNVGWPLLLLPMGASAVALVVRSRRSRGDERQQLKWMMLAGIVNASFITFWAVSAGMFGSDKIAEGLQGVALGTVPIAAGIAILKYRLYEIDVVINRTLVYATLTAVLGAMYVGLVFGLQAILAPFTAESDLAVAGSTLAVAALFGPIRSLLQRFIDQRFYRRKFDAQRTVEEFNVRLRNEVDLSAVTTQLVEVTRATMQPAHVSLWLRSGGSIS